MVIDELKAIRDVYTLIKTNEKALDCLEEKQRRDINEDYYIKSTFKDIDSKMIEVEKIPSLRRETRKRLETENQQNHSYNQQVLSDRQKEAKKGLVPLILLKNIKNIFFSVVIGVTIAEIVKCTNYNDPETLKLGVGLGIGFGVIALVILTIINVVKRIDESRVTSDNYVVQRMQKEMKDTSKYSEENINKEYTEAKERLLKEKEEFLLRKQKNDLAIKEFPLDQMEQIRKNIEIAKTCLAGLIKNSSLHEHYSSFVCVCQFIQYLDTGRCSTLEGPYGCYNLYESELRQNIIIAELSQINSTLHRIDETMSCLLTEVQRISTIAGSILDELKISNSLARDAQLNYKNTENNDNLIKNIEKNSYLIAACAAYNSSKEMPNSMKYKMITSAFSHLRD